MKKLQEMRAERKLNNKGFSLVELIIVIAIMAVLIAILAPQFIKYVERSRRSADLDTVDEIVNAVQAAYSDTEPDAGADVFGKSYKITLTSNANGIIANEGGSDTGLKTALESAQVDVTKTKLKSKWDESANSTVIIHVTSNGSCEITSAAGAYKSSDEFVKAYKK